MAATQFVPLTPELIDEGLFLEDMSQELAALQEQLATFKKQYGEKSEKAVAKLTIEISLKIENIEDEGAYSVKTTMKATAPKRPASVSIAIGGRDDDNKMALFVRKSGSDESSPKQLKLATRNGKIVNQDTGEVLDE
jgi:hypothetical protein